jgi:flagellar hook-length control protein FliK
MAAVRQNGGSLTIRLNPPMLGSVKVQMQIEGGIVGARIEVVGAQAHELLKGSMETLRAALEGKGLHVERLSVHLASGPASLPQDQGRNDPQHGGGGERQGPQDGADGRSRGSFDGREERAGGRPWRESESSRSESVGAGVGGFAARLRLRLDAIA